MADDVDEGRVLGLSSAGGQIRLVIWDLDETFWRGTFAEGNIEPIQENIDLVKALASRGIANSVCSKNHIAPVREALTQLGIWDYFVHPCISFLPKGVMINAILDATKMQAPSVLFIDDDAACLQEAQQQNKGLQIADPAILTGLLSDPRCHGDRAELPHDSGPEAAAPGEARAPLDVSKQRDQAEPAAPPVAMRKPANVKALEVQGTGNIIEIDDTAQVQLPVRIHGNNNQLIIGKHVRLSGVSLEIFGNGCSVVFHGNAMMHGHLRCRHDNTHVSYGSKTTAMNVKIHLHEAGSITIGDDCMISGNVLMNVSDVHSIMDRATGQRLNKARDIVIGDHVWLAQDVMVAKGCRIGSGSVVGAKSFVNGTIPENVVVAGVPAKIVRENVEWSRARL